MSFAEPMHKLRAGTDLKLDSNVSRCKSVRNYYSSNKLLLARESTRQTKKLKSSRWNQQSMLASRRIVVTDFDNELGQILII